MSECCVCVTEKSTYIPYFTPNYHTTCVLSLRLRGYIPVVYEQTNVPHIYAVGDVVRGMHELTPLAIQAGRLLAARLFSSATQNTNYVNCPTTVFTPLEFGTIGLAEEDANMIYGSENIEVPSQNFTKKIVVWVEVFH